MFTKIIKILTRTGYLPKSVIIFFVLVVSAALDIIVISIIAPIIFSSLGGDTNKQLDTLDIYNQLENFAPIELLAVALLIVKIIYQLITFNWIYKTAFKIFYDISIGSGVDIGYNVTINPGVRLGEGCIVNAGAVVSGTFAPFTIIAGNPAIIVGVRLPVN